MNIRFLVWLCFLSGLYCTAKAQTSRIEALRRQVYASKSEEQKLRALLDLTDEYQSLNRDSLDVYGPEIKTLAGKSGDAKLKSRASLAYANWYFRWGWSDSALVFIEPELKRYSVSDAANRDLYFKLHRAQAMLLASKSRLAEALEVLYKILPEAEQYKDTLHAGLASNSIGSVALAREKNAEAWQWIQKAIQLAGTDNRYPDVLAPAYLNAGTYYRLQGKTDSALWYIDKGLDYSRQLQNLNYTAVGLRIRSGLYTGLRQYDKAEKALLEMTAIRKELSPVSIFVEDNLQLAEFYANSGQLQKAIDFCKSNLKTGQLYAVNDTGNVLYTIDPKVRWQYLEALGRYYKMAGRPEEYQATLEEILVAKDSFYNANSAKAIAEANARYELQKKENTILQQRYGLQRNRFLLIGSLVFLLLSAVIVTYIFRDYRRRQQKRMQTAVEEEKRLGLQAVADAEENERRRIAADLHDNLGAYASSLVSSLSSITRETADQDSIVIRQSLQQNAQSIIAELNDTIWVLKKDHLSLTTISDRIKLFISRIRNAYPGTETDVEEEITTDHQLRSAEAFHLYRILQEAIHNALRHSQGSRVLVRFSEMTSWRVTVEDNGKGMSAVQTASADGGNGLLHMQDRARECGWSVQWLTRAGGGTIVEIKPTEK